MGGGLDSIGGLDRSEPEPKPELAIVETAVVRPSPDRDAALATLVARTAELRDALSRVEGTN